MAASRKHTNEYAVNIYDDQDDRFLYQYEVYQTYDEAKDIADKLHENHEIEDDEYPKIICIEYDEDGYEINAYEVD